MNSEEHIWIEERHIRDVEFMNDNVPGASDLLQLCSQCGIVLLLLLQLSAQRAQLLLSLHLDVISNHHCCLEVGLETAPLLSLVLLTHTQRNTSSVSREDALGFSHDVMGLVIVMSFSITLMDGH